MIGSAVPRRPSRFGMLLAVTAAATACSGGADQAAGGDEGQPAPIEPTVLAEELATEFTGDHPTRTARREGRCFAGELLDRVDPEQMRTAGLVGSDGHLVERLPDLSGRVATSWVAAQQACTDFITSSVEALAAQTKGSLDRQRYRTCLERSLTGEEIRAGLVAAVSGDLQGPEVAVLADAQATCAGRATPES